VAAVLLAVFEADLLYTAQEQNLFLHTPLFFEQQMVRAGGLLTWAGCYLTQFFYYPMLGAGLLGLLWAFLLWLLSRTFTLLSEQSEQARANPSPHALHLLPVACLLTTITTLGYWVFYLKLPGALFDATLGTIMAVLMAWAYRSLTARYGLRTVFIPLSACVAYPLFGFYGLWGVALMGLLSWRTKDSFRIADTVLALLAIVAVPLICYHTVYHETNIANIYWTALPVFSYSDHRFFGYYVPYIILVATIALFASKVTIPLPHREGLGVGLLLVLAILVAAFWYKDGNFHRELAMSRCIDRQDWSGVLSAARKSKEPTRAICLMRNLALFRLGQTGKEMSLYPNGSARPNAPFPVRLVHTYGKRLYLEYGIPNYCYRWSMEDGVEYGWTVERLRLMVLCSLVNGEFTAAQHYINLLKKTDFHDSWARRYQDLLYRPPLIANDPALKPILPLLRNDNFLTSDQSQLEHFLIEHILSTPGNTREQQELAHFTMRYYRTNRSKIIEP
jgi:hypothetical protein